MQQHNDKLNYTYTYKYNYGWNHSINIRRHISRTLSIATPSPRIGTLTHVSAIGSRSALYVYLIVNSFAPTSTCMLSAIAAYTKTREHNFQLLYTPTCTRAPTSTSIDTFLISMIMRMMTLVLFFFRLRLLLRTWLR